MTYAGLDPVAMQPESSKMYDYSREEQDNYATMNMKNLHSELNLHVVQR